MSNAPDSPGLYHVSAAPILNQAETPLPLYQPKYFRAKLNGKVVYFMIPGHALDQWNRIEKARYGECLEITEAQWLAHAPYEELQRREHFVYGEAHFRTE